MNYEELEVIRKNAEEANGLPFTAWSISQALYKDIPALIAEVERLNAQISEANSLLSVALDKMDNAHLFDTEAFRNISKYLYGEDDGD